MIELRKGDSKLVGHARRELEIAGLFTPNKKDDYDGFIGKGVLALVKVFDEWSEDDANKMSALHQVFNFLVQGDLLSPPSNDPDEWEDFTVEGQTVRRNKRNIFYITRDEGKTWFNLRNEQRGVCNDYKTGKPIKGVVLDDGPSETNEDKSGTTNAGNKRHGKNSIKSAIADGATAPSAEGEGDAEPRWENSQAVENRELDAGVEPKGETPAGEAEASAKE